MKKFTCFLFFFAALLSSITAQSAFRVLPSPSEVVSLPEEVDNVAHAYVKNLTNSIITVSWQRFEVDLPDTMYTLVCDPTICYGPATSAQTFTLMPLDSGEMDVHFVNEIGLITTAHVRLRLVNQANPADTLWVDYRFDSQTLDANDRLEKETVKLYPNPVTDYFMLENATAVAAIRVYTLDGRQVSYFQATPEQRYTLTGLPAGAYILALENKEGRVLQSTPLRKE